MVRPRLTRPRPRQVVVLALRAALTSGAPGLLWHSLQDTGKVKLSEISL